MVMIIGGAAQGKRTYALENYKDAQKHIFALNDFVRTCLEEEKNPAQEVEKQILKDPDLIILTEEIGCGIVPLEKEERVFRDCMGRVQIETAKRADEVIRVICGLGQKLK